MLIHKLYQSMDESGDKEVLRSEKHTDANGNTLYEAEYDSSGELASIRRLKYNEQHQMVEESIEGPDDMVYEVHHFTYREDGKLLEERVEYADGSVSTGKLEYEDGITRILWYNEDDELEQSEETSEDKDGNLLFTLTRDADGNLLQKQEYQRDEKGRTVETVLFEEEHGSRSMFYEYAEDPENGKRARVIKDHNGYVVQAVFEALDENGRVVEEIREEPARGIKHTHDYEYDENGRLKELTITNDKGRTVQEHKIDYNSDGKVSAEYLFAQPGIEMWSRHEYTETT